jgi:hypothetical protein
MRTAARRSVLAAALGALLAAPAAAQTFRSIQPILAPDAQMREAIRQGATLRGAAIPGLRQVPREAVEEAVRKIYASYNTPDFRQYLSERFYDPERLLMAIDEKVPREAKLRLLSISSAQTVSTQRTKDEQGLDVVESLVLVVARAQIEFTSLQGFQRREGEQELVLRFREPQ